MTTRRLHRAVEPAASALVVNKLYQLVNDEFLFTDYVFHQISN